MTDSPKRTYILSIPEPKYFEELGRFIDAFAAVEAMLFQLLAFYAKIDLKMAAAILSGARVDGCISYIRRILSFNSYGEASNQELEILFPHLKDINDARNDVVHYSSF